MKDNSSNWKYVVAWAALTVACNSAVAAEVGTPMSLSILESAVTDANIEAEATTLGAEQEKLKKELGAEISKAAGLKAEQEKKVEKLNKEAEAAKVQLDTKVEKLNKEAEAAKLQVNAEEAEKVTKLEGEVAKLKAELEAAKRKAVEEKAILEAKPERNFTFRPTFVLGKTISRSGEDFSRQDDFFAITVDANTSDCDPAAKVGIDKNCLPHNRRRQFLQLDYRLTPTFEMKDGKSALSDKRSGYFGAQYYFEHAGQTQKNGFERFGGWGALGGLQTVPASDRTAWFIAPMWRVNVLRVTEPYESPNVYGYLLVAWGRWSNFDNNRATGRLYLEGRYQLADSPLLLGFEANSGAGADDLRILVAFKIDAEKFFSGLKLSPK